MATPLTNNEEILPTYDVGKVEKELAAHQAKRPARPTPLESQKAYDEWAAWCERKRILESKLEQAKADASRGWHDIQTGEKILPGPPRRTNPNVSLANAAKRKSSTEFLADYTSGINELYALKFGSKEYVRHRKKLLRIARDLRLRAKEESIEVEIPPLPVLYHPETHGYKPFKVPFDDPKAQARREADRRRHLAKRNAERRIRTSKEEAC